MTEVLHHEIEVAEDSATMYLSGTLAATDLHSLRTACGNLPPAVRTLRLDLHGVASMANDGMDTVRGVLQYWRESRNGSFRLSLASERIVATYAEGSFANLALSLRHALPHVVEAAPATRSMCL